MHFDLKANLFESNLVKHFSFETKYMITAQVCDGNGII